MMRDSLFGPGKFTLTCIVTYNAEIQQQWQQRSLRYGRVVCDTTIISDSQGRCVAFAGLLCGRERSFCKQQL
jgi:hypothetical protein